MKRRQDNDRGGFTFWELVAVLAVFVLLAGLLLPALARAKQKAYRINCVSNLMQIGTATRLWAGDNADRLPDRVPVPEGGLARTNAGGMRAVDVFRFFQVMSNELNVTGILLCPEDRARLHGRKSDFNFQSEGPDSSFTNNLVISYFVGCGASQDCPGMLLSGDRNIYGPTTDPNSNDGYGNSPPNGSGACVVFGTNLPTNEPLRVGWTARMHGNAGNVAFADGSTWQVGSRQLVEAFNRTGDTNTVPGANAILFP